MKYRISENLKELIKEIFKVNYDNYCISTLFVKSDNKEKRKFILRSINKDLVCLILVSKNDRIESVAKIDSCNYGSFGYESKKILRIDDNNIQIVNNSSVPKISFKKVDNDAFKVDEELEVSISLMGKDEFNKLIKDTKKVQQ